MKAVAYLRVSTEEQATEDKVSLEGQEAAIRAYCVQRGYEMAHIYCDPGYTGESPNRPAFRQMCRDAEGEQFERIVIWRSDRLCRGLRPYVIINDALEGTEIELEATNDTVSRRWLAMKAFMAGEELEAMKERMKSARRGRAERGQVFGVVVYGYERGPDGTPAIVEEEAAVIRRIFNLYLSGHSSQQIADILNSEGVPTPGGRGKWWNQRITTILKDPTYLGTAQHLKHRWIKKFGAERDTVLHQTRKESDQVAVPYPPIIDQDTYHKAAQRRKHYHRAPAGQINHDNWLLRDILWCGYHDRPYVLSWANRRGGGQYRYYLCNVGTKYPETHGRCPWPRLKEEEIDTNVIFQIYKMLLNPATFKMIGAQARESIQNGHAGAGIARHNAKLEELTAQRSRLLSDYLTLRKYFTEDELGLKARQLNEAIEYHETEIKRLSQETSTYAHLVDHLNTFDYDAVAQEIECSTAEEARDIFAGFQLVCFDEAPERLVDRVTVLKDNLEIRFKSAELVSIIDEWLEAANSNCAPRQPTYSSGKSATPRPTYRPPPDATLTATIPLALAGTQGVRS